MYTEYITTRTDVDGKSKQTSMCVCVCVCVCVCMCMCMCVPHQVENKCLFLFSLYTQINIHRINTRIETFQCVPYYYPALYTKQSIYKTDHVISIIAYPSIFIIVVGSITLGSRERTQPTTGGALAVGVPGKGPSLPQCCRESLLWVNELQLQVVIRSLQLKIDIVCIYLFLVFGLFEAVSSNCTSKCKMQ